MRVERVPAPLAVDFVRLALLRERVPPAPARLAEAGPLDFDPVARALLARVVRDPPLERVLPDPLLARVLRDPLPELDLPDPPLLDCGMVPPSNYLTGSVHPTFNRCRTGKQLACLAPRGT